MTQPCAPELFTIGHSNHSLERFLGLIRAHGVKAIVDVRTVPASSYSPHFNQESLQQALTGSGVRYVYLGKELGGRPADTSFYDAAGHALYGRMANSLEFDDGLIALRRVFSELPTAILCSEEDPGVCHRGLLIAPVLAEQGVRIKHIRGNGALGHASWQKAMLEDVWKSVKPIRSASPSGPPRTFLRR